VGPRSYTKGKPEGGSSRKKWGFNTGASAMTPPGVGNGRIFAVSNDRMLYSIKPGLSGGDWSNGWRPFAMNGASQARPSVVSMNVNRINGAPRVVFVSSQDGYVYAIDADTGAALWETQLGEIVQGAPSVAFREYGIGLTNVDLIIAGTRNSNSANGVYALNTQGGGVAWSYTGGGTYPIGVIGGQVSIDYPTRRVYFASRAASSATDQNHTLWCISFDDTSATRVWSIPIGDVDGSPVVRNGTLYVGTNNGTLYAVNPNDGTVLASYATTDGPVKGFPFPNSDGRVYFSTTNKVWSVIDSVTPPRTLTQGWQYPVLSPSTPVFANNSLYVGSSNGRLRQFTSLTSGFPSVTEVYLSLDVVGMPVGTIGFDYQNNLAYVGTAEGVVNAVSPQ
jgi:eukaryotic-like serine/threonine-protein kinase